MHKCFGGNMRKSFSLLAQSYLATYFIFDLSIMQIYGGKNRIRMWKEKNNLEVRFVLLCIFSLFWQKLSGVGRHEARNVQTSVISAATRNGGNLGPTNCSRNGPAWN